MSGCCTTKIVQVNSGGNLNANSFGSSLTFDPGTGLLGLVNTSNVSISSVTIPITSTPASEFFVNSTSTNMSDTDGDTFVSLVESGATNGAGDIINFTVDGNVVMSLESSKLTLNGIFIDPASGLELLAQSSVPPQANDPNSTLWLNTGQAGNLYRGTKNLEEWVSPVATNIIGQDSEGRALLTSSGISNPNQFLSNTLVNPITAGEPTDNEILLAASGQTDLFLFYTGTDLDTDPISHIWFIDNTGSIIRVRTPSTGAGSVSVDNVTVGGDGDTTPLFVLDDSITLAKLADGTPGKLIGFDATTGDPVEVDSSNPTTFLSNTLVSPTIVGEPTDVEILAAAGTTVDTIVYYTGNDTATDAPSHVYYIDLDGNIINLVSPENSVDTNLANNDLLADADRTHDFASFSQTWNNLNVFTESYAGTGTSALFTKSATGITITNTHATAQSDFVMDGVENTISFASGGSTSSFSVKDGTVGAASGVAQTHVTTQGVSSGSSTTSQVLTLTNPATGEVEFSDVGFGDILFADETTVAPTNAGDPTLIEIQSFAGMNRNTFITYNGTDTDNGDYTHLFYIDNSGNVIDITDANDQINLYNTDSSLTGNREVTLNGSTLTLIPDTGVNTAFNTDGFNDAAGWFAVPVSVTASGAGPTVSTQTDQSAYTNIIIDSTSTGDVTVNQGPFNFNDQPYLIQLVNNDGLSRDVVFTATQFMMPDGTDFGTITIPPNSVRHLQFFRSGSESFIMFDSDVSSDSSNGYVQTFTIADWADNVSNFSITIPASAHGRGTNEVMMQVYEDDGTKTFNIQIDELSKDNVSGDVLLMVDASSGPFDGYIIIN